MTTTGNDTDASAVVHAYYDAITGGADAFDPQRLRALLADDLLFEGPLAGTMTGADRFVQGVSGFAATAGAVTVHAQVEQDGRVATLYDAEMPAGTVRFAEFVDVVDGRITAIRLLYEGEKYLAAGGR